MSLATVLTSTMPSPVETADGMVTDRCAAFPSESADPTNAIPDALDPTWTVWVVVSDNPPASVTFSDTV